MAAYVKQKWVDQETPLDAAHLNHVEEGIDANSKAAEQTAADIGKLSEDITDIETNVYAQNNVTGVHLTINSDGKYHAYITTNSNEDVEVVHCGKNILPKPNANVSTFYGITFTPNEDGTVHVKGTAASNASFYVVTENNRQPLKKGVYTFSGVKEDLANSARVVLGITGVGEKYSETPSGTSVNINSDTTYYFRIMVWSGATVDFTCYPQIEVGQSCTPWEPYECETILINATKSAKVKLFAGLNNFICENEIVCKYFYMAPSSSNNLIVNLKEIGAVGDGLTDDTVAINRALSLAENGILYIPKGTYLFSSTLYVKTGTKIIGCGTDSIFKLADTFSLESYSWRPETTNFETRSSMMLFDEDAKGCEIRNFELVGQTNSYIDQNEDGITVRGANHIIENVIVHDINFFPDEWSSSRIYPTPGYGIAVMNAENVTINNAEVYNCGYEDIGTECASNVTITNCKLGAANQTGMQVHRMCEHIVISNNNINALYMDTWHASLTFDADQNVAMNYIYAHNNTIHGNVVTVGGGENSLFYTANRIYGNFLMDVNGRTLYTDKLLFSNNYLNGLMKVWSDNALITGNMINNNNTSVNMITANGNNILITNNNGIGKNDNVEIITH